MKLDSFASTGTMSRSLRFITGKKLSAAARCLSSDGLAIGSAGKAGGWAYFVGDEDGERVAAIVFDGDSCGRAIPDEADGMCEYLGVLLGADRVDAASVSEGTSRRCAVRLVKGAYRRKAA